MHETFRWVECYEGGELTMSSWLSRLACALKVSRLKVVLGDLG